MKIRSNAASFITAFVLLGLAAAVPVAARADGSGARSATIDGVTIYLGVAPAQMIRTSYARESSERTMHGGVPTGRYEQHVMIALFNAGSGRRITNAEATATVRQVGLYGQTKRLQPMTIAGDLTYGNYFRMSSNTMYRIELSIERPGVARDVRAEFDYEDVAH